MPSRAHLADPNGKVVFYSQLRKIVSKPEKYTRLKLKDLVNRQNLLFIYSCPLAPYGKQFFAADVGVPALIETYGGGDVGGNDYKDALFSYGPRGKNKPKITEDAVIKLPSMDKVERGNTIQLSF